MNFVFLLVLVGIFAWAITGLIRRYALARNVLDVPNRRSSHAIATPRGGGMAIVLSFLVGYGWVYLQSRSIPLDAFIALLGAGALVAILGFLDDHGHIAARWRLLGHFTAAVWALGWLGGFSTLELGGMLIKLGWISSALAAVYLVWLLNLYNFMDGIDGLASFEAITVCLSISLLYSLIGHADLAYAPLIVAVAACGFLLWNFPFARIFMGDAGSGFLGILLGVLSIQGAKVEPGLLWVWLILLGVFIVDATFTLLRRLLRGDKVYQAHRSHGYQSAVRLYGRHWPVTLGIVGINLFWLLPIAYAVSVLGWNGLYGVVLAYGPLVFLAWKYQAGALEDGSENDI